LKTAPTRWKLRKAIRIVCQTLDELQVSQHPDKTFIGRISRGFDFLGYHITTDALGLAEKTVTNFVERVTQLYEHGAEEVRIGEYVRRWRTWVVAGLGFRIVDWIRLNVTLRNGEDSSVTPVASR